MLHVPSTWTWHVYGCTHSGMSKLGLDAQAWKTRPFQRATSEVSFSSVAGSEGYRTPEQSLRIEIVTPPTAKPRQIFASPSRTSSESDRHPPPKVADLKSIAEETQRIIQEATTGTAMERIPAPTLEKNRETLAARLSKGVNRFFAVITSLKDWNCFQESTT